MRTHTTRTLAAILVTALLAVAAGCKVTSEDVERWKGTQKGPGKLVAVLLADKYPIELRQQAALALIEMERGDVDGLQELQRALHRLDDETQAQIIDGITPGLVRLMAGAGAAQPSPTGEMPPPTAQQKRAKDAAYLLIARARPATRQVLTEAVVGWFVQDFGGRSLAGNYSAEQVVRSLGAPGAAVLVSALNARMPKEALVKVAELIGQLADAQTKQRTAERLIEIEREMESDAYLEWMRGPIRAQLQAAGRAVDEQRVNTIASLNRESFINDAALPAMKFLGDQPAVSARLLEIALQPSREGDPLTERRTRALKALEGHAVAGQLQRLLDIALDPNAPTGVRDYAFDRIADIRSPAALPRLWPLVSSTSDWRLRWRAGEMVLQIGGTAVVGEFFQKLPAGRDAKYAAEELLGYATRLGQMSPLPTEVVRSQLQSPDWFKRIIALRYYERKGTLADVPLLQALTNDNTAVAAPEGARWEPNYTVGKAAEASIRGLLERLGTAGAQPQQGG
jgi:HEAT repeat protein